MRRSGDKRSGKREKKKIMQRIGNKNPDRTDKIKRMRSGHEGETKDRRIRE